MGVKAREIIVSVKLARSRSKNWIMTQYLNTVYLGADSYGVGAAARTYFNQPASRLDLAQAAMLAAMINQPGYFLPDPAAGAPYRALVARWRYVLTNMTRDGVISARTAAAQPGNFGAGAGAPYWFTAAGPDDSMSVGLFGGSQAGSPLPAVIWKTFQAQAAGGGPPPVAVPGW